MKNANKRQKDQMRTAKKKGKGDERRKQGGGGQIRDEGRRNWGGKRWMVQAARKGRRRDGD